MKALTLWQPWASLIAVGAKTIETRGWSTTYRGPLAIHAAKTSKGFYELPGDCEGNEEGGYHYGYLGDFQAAYCHHASDEGKRGDAYIHRHEVDEEPTWIPLGAVVATCTLVDVVPVENLCLCIDIGARGWRHQQLLREYPLIGPDQFPYGDYSPGRFAWLLADIKALEEPVPAKGRQGFWEWVQ